MCTQSDIKRQEDNKEQKRHTRAWNNLVCFNLEKKKNEDGARWELAREGRKPYDSLVHGNQEDSYSGNYLNSGEQEKEDQQNGFHE